MTKRLLVIDDEANLRWVLSEALSDQGYDVVVAANANDGLAAMSRQPADVVILDLKLKGMDGLATLARLRERWPEVVVLILTAYGTVASAVEAMQLGAADYLRKPFDLEEIGFQIATSLGTSCATTRTTAFTPTTATAHGQRFDRQSSSMGGLSSTA